MAQASDWKSRLDLLARRSDARRSAIDALQSRAPGDIDNQITAMLFIGMSENWIASRFQKPPSTEHFASNQRMTIAAVIQHVITAIKRVSREANGEHDLLIEFAALPQPENDREIAQQIREHLGWTRTATASAKRNHLNAKVASVHLDRASWTWQPFEGGEPALVFPVWAVPPHGGGGVAPGIPAHPGVPVDLAAYSILSDKLYLRTGAAVSLGEHQLRDIDRRRETAGHLLVSTTPREWIVSGGEGVMPIDWRQFYHNVCRHKTPLVTRSIDAGKQLRARLDALQPALPQIGVLA
ncbi:hypothetical protein [Thalassobaculum litoreum]|uniref:Uncharacterized protein n=1 Tax=Thalassobaculum litoreum DSM 18839 TaxID=1123362 RepID=A0A8G2BI05_9PROT|nr:hypothetical protein [Thalassobaculum litoreum]SDF82950.1 hypothetical protein SAMN05660686_02443 [Thalassobaculum litoreum DSM 18839]